jgi:phage/conjugal plasmid C-4 type zinc finger TraR family protein
MAGGWAKDGAVQDQIDASIADAVKLARQQLPKGESLLHCKECGEEIPKLRQEAILGVQYCISCQSELEQEEVSHTTFNRRGSKDSQLR